MSNNPVQNEVFMEKKPKQENEGQRNGYESSNDGDESSMSEMISHISDSDSESDSEITIESECDNETKTPNLHLKISRDKKGFRLNLCFRVERK